MKIFSWVHRKYNQKDGLLDRNVKKNELTISNEIIGDTQLLLQDASMEHMLDGWKGGILTIGTFGFGPLKDQRDQLDIEVNEDEECEITVSDDEKDEQLIINPLMYANGHEQSHHEALKANKSEEEGRKKHQIKKERITLADLFSADFDKENIPRANNINPGDKLQPDLFMTMNKASNSQVKNGLSFAKKLMPQVREDSHPILKLQQLMTRVLKRKVHPDMESKNHKTSRVIAAATMLESISLLKIQETIA